MNYPLLAYERRKIQERKAKRAFFKKYLPAFLFVLALLLLEIISRI